MNLLQLLLPVLGTLLAASVPADPVVIVFPAAQNTVLRAPTMSIVVRYDSTRIHAALLLRPYAAGKKIKLTDEKKKLGFAKDIFHLIPPDVLLEHVTVSTNLQSTTYRFDLLQKYDIERFWASPEMQQIWATVHGKKVNEASVDIVGWTFRSLESTEERRSTYGDMFLFSVDLEPGLNAYKMMFIDAKGTVVKADSCNVYRAIPTDWVGAPEGYKPAMFHGSAAEGNCTTCHKNIEESCGTCHQSFSKLQSYHPVADDCSLCHDMSSGRESRLIEGQEYNSELCFTCHSEKQELTASADHVHGTVSECQLCHDPHGSRNPTLLRSQTRNLCAACHEDDAARRHPVASHPFEAPEERNRPGKSFTCSSCHEPHASANEKLLRFSEKPICSNCHNF